MRIRNAGSPVPGRLAREERCAMPRGVRKSDLPVKTCAHCGRPFTWRKKWERVWDAVKFCSDRCRADSRRARPPSAPD